MSSFRQLATGLFYALVSVVLVVGGLSLALSEGALKPAPPPTNMNMPSPTLLPPSATATEPSPTPQISPLIPSATPLVIIFTETPYSASPTLYVRPASTATNRVYPTPIPCGPFAGWIRSYTVQPGDTLFHISTLYRTTVNALQVANCKSTTLILPGELLWVPNVPTVTPGVTVIPTFATSTPMPTEPATLTPFPSYFTETAVPTDTTSPDP